MQCCVQALIGLINYAKEVDRENAALMIYKDLLAKLQQCKDWDDFYQKNPKIKQHVNTLLDCCAQATDKKEKLHLIGWKLQAILKDRFCKEETRNPETSLENHATNWFKQNKYLLPSIDSEWVHAGFVSMFQL